MKNQFDLFRLSSEKGILILILLCFLISPLFGQISTKYKNNWKNPDVVKTIENNIETFRKGDACITLLSEKGKPVSNATVKVQQLDHEFLFGCNLFFLKGFETEKENKKYESAFVNLFNFATAPFYWSDLEPEEGKLRFSKDSEPIFRRPPPDLLIEFARKNKIQLKGHPLVWHAYYPEWLPQDEGKVKKYITKRMSEISARYAKELPIWDVVNESLVYNWSKSFPDDYVAYSFREANRWFNKDNILMINEVTTVSHNYRSILSPYYLQIENLKLHDIRVDGIGFQFHLFSQNAFREVMSGDAYTPQNLLNVYDLYQDFNVPLYITEITIPSLQDYEEEQAELTRNFYRLWFSIPQMAGITLWNLGDGTALKGENKWNGGMLDENLNPKKSYEILDQLINHEWKTQTEGKTSDQGQFSFRGFYGTYLVKVKSGKKEQEFRVSVSKDGAVNQVLTMN